MDTVLHGAQSANPKNPITFLPSSRKCSNYTLFSRLMLYKMNEPQPVPYYQMTVIYHYAVLGYRPMCT